MAFFKKTDLLLIAILVAVSGIAWFVYGSLHQEQGELAEVYYYSQLVKTVQLTEGKEETFSLDEHPQVVFAQYADGRIAFLSSDCPDQVCVHAGKLSRVGESAACLPNGFVLKIVPAKERKETDLDLTIGQ